MEALLTLFVERNEIRLHVLWLNMNIHPFILYLWNSKIQRGLDLLHSLMNHTVCFCEDICHLLCNYLPTNVFSSYALNEDITLLIITFLAQYFIFSRYWMLGERTRSPVMKIAVKVYCENNIIWQTKTQSINPGK